MSEDLLKEPLPEPWTFGVTNDGRVFFINDEAKVTTWLHPDTGEALQSGYRRRTDLPQGWEESFTDTGAPYYVNHNNHTTTFTFPEKLEEKRKDSKKPKGKAKSDHPYENIENTEPGQEKKRRRRSFMERSGMNLFRRSSSKLKIKPDTYEKSPKKMKDPKEKQEKKLKAARPLSAQSARSTRSSVSAQGKMTVSRRDPNLQVSKSGWLYKQDSTGKMKMWRKKWFVLVDFCLYYYKDANEGEILGNIILPSYTVSTLTAEDKISRKYSFKVEHSGMRTYYLSADSYNDMAQWITALQKSCAPTSPGHAPSETVTDAVPFMEEEESKGGDGTKSKKRDSSESRKKSKHHEEDDDSEFGFTRITSPSNISSQPPQQAKSHGEKGKSANHSTNNNKYDPEIILQKNGRIPSDSHDGSRSPKDVKVQEKPHEKAAPRRIEEHHQQRSAPPRSSGGERVSLRKQQPRQENRGRSGAPPNAAYQHHGQPQSQPTQRRDQNGAHMRQPPQAQRKNVRRENGESAYFSDTSGATDSSRFANSSDRSNPHNGTQQQTGQPELKRQNSLVKLGNWVMNQKMRQQSGNNVNSPQQRGHHPNNFDTASEYSSVSHHTRKSATLSARGPHQQGPPSSRRYRARTYNEYMDPMEVASSIISMPPLQQVGPNKMYVAQTLPRPNSSENVNKMGRPGRYSGRRQPDPGRRMVPSKSAGNIVEVDQYGNPISPRQTQQMQGGQNIKRAKSDYAFQDQTDAFQQQYLANFMKAQQMNNQAFRAPRQQARPAPGGRSGNEYRSTGSASNSSSGGQTPRRSANRTTPRSVGSPSDVFTPISSASAQRSAYNGQIFRFETTDSSLSRAVKKNSAVTNPPANLNVPPAAGQSNSGVEVKQVQKGGFRAFVLSARSPQTQLPPPERQTPLKATDNSSSKSQKHQLDEQDIEARLQRLNDLGRNLLQICDDVRSLQGEKERLEAELSISRSKLQSRYSTAGSNEHSQQLNRELHQLETELGNVRAQLANAEQKMREMSRENENFEYDIRRMKARVMDVLGNQKMLTDDVYNGISKHDKESKRKLEWELGRLEFMLEGVNKQKATLLEKMKAIGADKADESPLMSPVSPTSITSTSSSRSPREVKRSHDRRAPQTRPSYSSTSSGGTPTDTPVKKYFTLPGRGVQHATSVDSVTAETLMRSRPTSARSYVSIGSSNTNLHRTKSAAERLFQTSYGNQASDLEAREMKRLQKEITRNRRNNLMAGTGDSPRRYSNPAGMTLPRSMKVGIDVQMALKHHRMPKVLQRAKRDMARAEMEKLTQADFSDMDQKASPRSTGLYENAEKVSPTHREEDVEPEPEIQLDVNLTHQLIAPDKVDIPERLVEYDNIELSPAEEKMKHQKVVAIEKMLAKSGQQASLPAVHLAAALAVEAGSVARAVAIHAATSHRTPGDGQKESGERPVTDGSSSAGEDQDPGAAPAPLTEDPEYMGAYIV